MNAIKYKLNDVRMINKLSLPIQTNSSQGDIRQQYPHLRELSIETYKDAVPQNLIGLDNWKLDIPLLIREGSWREPVATQTRLGWIIHGFNDKTSDSDTNYQHQSFICNCNTDTNLHKMVPIHH